MPPYLSFASLDRKSVRFTLPLATVRRVERLNARAGIYALSISTWHGPRLVRILFRAELKCIAIDLAGGSTDIVTPQCRRLLCHTSGFIESRTTEGSDEGCQDVRQDMLFGSSDIHVVQRC